MSSKIKSLLKEIREDIKNKEYKIAIRKCNELLSEEPNNYMALVFMGAAYQDQDKKEAAKYLQRAVLCDKNPIVALQGLVNIADDDELPDILQKLLKSVPDKYLDYHRKLVTIVNNDNKNLEKCIEILQSETLLENNEKNSDRLNSAWRHIVKILMKQTEIPNKFENLFEESLRIVVNDKDFENHLECSKRYLKLLYKLQKFNELLEEACKFHEQYPDNVYPLEWICKIYSENYATNAISFETYFKNSINSYSDKLISLNENSSLGLFVKAIKHYQNEEYIAARNFLFKVKVLQPKNTNALNLLAELYMKIGAYEMAVNVMKQLKIKDIHFATCLSYSKVKTFLLEAIDVCKSIKLCDENEFQIKKILIRTYFNLGEFEEAKKVFSEIKEIDVDSEEKVLVEAEYFMEPENAIQELQNLKKTNEFDVNLLMGLKYLELKKYEKSLESILIATKQRPYFSECFMLLGKIYFALKDLIRARKCFEKCINLNPQNEIAVTNLSAIYRKTEEWNLNAALLENTVKSYEGGKCPWAHFQLGLHYLSIHQYDEAIHALQSVVRLDLNNIIYWETLADAYQQRGSYNSAMKVNEKILELDNNNLNAKLQIAILKTTLRMYDEAIQIFNEILKEYPDFIPALKGIVDAYYGLAKNLFSMRLLASCRNHLQEAVEHLQKAFLVGKRNMVWLWRMMATIFTMVGCLPKSKAYLHVLGQLAGQEENEKEIRGNELFEFAEKFYICALKLNQDDHLIWHELALCYYNYGLYSNDNQNKLNCFKQSIDVCKQAILLNPNRWENWNLMGVIFATDEIRNLSRAQHCFIKALNIDKRAAIVWTNLGTLYLSVDDIKLANKSFKKSQQSNPNYLNAWIGQAIIAEQIGELEESIDLFRHCTQLGFHIESALGYAYLICSILSDSQKLQKKSYKYAIEEMHAIPVALDSMVWYYGVEEDNSSVEALSYLGYLNCKQLLWKSAIKAYQVAVQNASDIQIKDKMLCNLGYSFVKSNQLQEAVKAFNSVNEGTLKSTIGLAFACSKAGNLEDAYTMYNSALEWLANTEMEKSSILMEISAIVYATNGETDTKPLLYQILAFSDKPIQALYFACALGIIHKDWELTEAVLDELKSFENDLEHCHHIAFLTAHYYSANKQPRKGLNHLLSYVHIFPDQPLLRKSLAEYLLKHSSKSKKQMHLAASQIAQSIIPLGLIRSTTSLETAKALTVASVAAGYIDKNKKRILAQSAVHMDPTYKEAWLLLQSC